MRPGGGRSRTLVVLLAVLSGTSGCAEMEIAAEMIKVSGRSGQASAPPRQAGPAAAAQERRAPDVFADSATGRWNGRETIGGVWIAHPDAADPTRVVVTDMQSGRSVVGAMFRRRAAEPGGGVQLSSAAARALGAPPNRAVPLEIVALAPHATRALVVPATPSAGRVTAQALPPPDSAAPLAPPEAAAVAAASAPTTAGAMPGRDAGRSAGAPPGVPAATGAMPSAGAGASAAAPEHMASRPAPRATPALALAGRMGEARPRPRPAGIGRAADPSRGLPPRPRPARLPASEALLAPAAGPGHTTARVG
ncbi:hypothetical protein [Oceanicella sp. SM1341]|uniref:hypothetical protein n=1 Tax=Oceanicella sp. SM1341 TaxID=1548889 RepID=UPI00130021FE|nr:hypothetical protein [Oceanicella sp. SM1341]